MWDGNTEVSQANPRRCDDFSREGSDVVTPDELL
jgi:hypothetical protein